MSSKWIKKFPTFTNENKTPSPGLFTERRSPSSNCFSSKISGSFLKAGIFAINSEKKYSLLSVPKASTRFMNICKQKSSQNNTISEIAPCEISTPTNFTSRETKKFKENKSVNNSFTSRYPVLNSYRFKKNPNQENLKNALSEIEKNPQFFNENKPVDVKNEKIVKSDIEILMESRHNKYANKILKSGEKVKIEEKKKISRNNSNDSQKSDPSPVRKNKQIEKIERSSTSQRLLEKKHEKINQKIGKKQLKFNLEKKFERNWLVKYMRQNLDSSPSEESSSDLEDKKKKFDYNLESMKILKNTSSFANKIMKGIRYFSQKKDF